MRTILITTILLSVVILTGCPDNSGDPFVGGENTTAGQVNTPYTIAISVPTSNAITQLEGEAAGFYSIVGSAIVTDRNGNPAPDGTVVHLDAIDSVIATGTADSLSGTSLTDAAPTLADSTGTSFTTAAVARNGVQRFIQADDLLLLTDNADSIDKNRFVSVAPTSMTSLDVKAAYSTTYPNTTYPAGSTTYVIGQSLLGVSVVGVDEEGNKTSGVATTQDGIAGFRMEFPANSNTIRVGCGDPAVDTRYLPAGSADVYVVARLGDDRVSTISEDFCFGSILPWTLVSVPSSLSATGDVILTLKDTGTVGLPFVTLTPSVTTTGAVTVTATPCTTTVGGSCTSTITVAGGASGNTATVTYADAGANTSVDVTVTVP